MPETLYDLVWERLLGKEQGKALCPTGLTLEQMHKIVEEQATLIGLPDNPPQY